MDAETRAELRMESAIHKIAGQLMLFHEDLHIYEIEDRLEALARKLGQPEPDRLLLRRAFMRVYIGLCWQRIEAHYGFFAGATAFEQRLDAWVDAFMDLARPLRLLELFGSHMNEKPRMPLIRDIARQIGQAERLRGPVQEEPEKRGKSTPGYGQQLISEWLARRRSA